MDFVDLGAFVGARETEGVEEGASDGMAEGAGESEGAPDGASDGMAEGEALGLQLLPDLELLHDFDRKMFSFLDLDDLSLRPTPAAV